MPSATATRSSPSASQEVNVQVEAVSPDKIKTLRLADGDHQVSDCTIVQFAVGESHSPITPGKLWPYVRYTDELTGQQFWTPFGAVLGLSVDQPSSSAAGRMSGQGSSQGSQGSGSSPR